MSQNPEKKPAARRRRETAKKTQPRKASSAKTTQSKSSPKPAGATSTKSVTATKPAAASKSVSKKQAEQKKQRMRQMIMGAVAVAVVLAVILVVVNRPTPGGETIDYSGVDIVESELSANHGTPVADEQPLDLSYATGPMVGDANAPVTMHIYSDFQCPFCYRFHADTLPFILDDFVRTGQVKLMFHDFPRLGTDPNVADPDDLTVEMRDPNNESSASSQAAMCAGEQGLYLEMADKLFANQRGEQQGAFKRNVLDRFASDLKLDTGAFGECMDSGRYIPALAFSVEQGQEFGINATPMFILDNGNGDPVVVQQTVQGYELMKKQIELAVKTAP